MKYHNPLGFKYMNNDFIFNRSTNAFYGFLLCSVVPLLFSYLNYRHDSLFVAACFFLVSFLFFSISICKKKVSLTGEGLSVSTQYLGIEILSKHHSISKTDKVLLKKVKSDTSSMQPSILLEMILLSGGHRLEETAIISVLSESSKDTLMELASSIKTKYGIV